LIETELTLDDVVNWFHENPKGGFHLFLKEQEENMTVSDMPEQSRLYQERTTVFRGAYVVRYDEPWNKEKNPGWVGSWIVLAVLRSDTPEGDPKVRELLRTLWLRDHGIVESAMNIEYGTIDLDTALRRFAFTMEGSSMHLPDHLLDLYLDPDVAPKLPSEAPTEKIVLEDGTIASRPIMRIEDFGLASTLAFCDSPKAGAILEKWVNGTNEEARPDPDDQWINVANKDARPRLERCLALWQARNTLRQKKMEVFQDLVAGRMVPDDLLLPQPPWVWKEGKYVQE
jgi:hypothetical protein